MNFGLTSLAAPQAASSSVSRYSLTERRVAAIASQSTSSDPSAERCLFASALIRLASAAKPSPPTSPSAMQRHYQSGEVDSTGSISKCGDRCVRTLLYEAANVMLTRYKWPLKLKDCAFAIAKRSAVRKRGSPLLDVLLSSACHAATRHRIQSGVVISRRRSNRSSRAERCPREGLDDGADFAACAQLGQLRFQPSRSVRSCPAGWCRRPLTGPSSWSSRLRRP